MSISRSNNILEFFGTSCRRFENVKRNDRTLEFALYVMHLVTWKSLGKLTDIKIIIKTTGGLIVIWGCVEINATFHEEMCVLWIATDSSKINPFIDRIKTKNWIKPYALMMHENKSSISDVQISEVMSIHFKNASNDLSCDKFQCKGEKFQVENGDNLKWRRQLIII